MRTNDSSSRRGRPVVTLTAIGGAWVKDGRSAVLAVPSAIVEREDNYLLDPAHLDFRKIRIGKAEPFTFDTPVITLAHPERTRRR